ncbi:uncharacterized protein BDW43DRAFT_279009 [Aspergillus alliaceus]|uniref:uncharacterized protein n=1 Tax=Petromyces alliaceus TaxID=209559 RepID=UPI0012A59720|nr:uncharacterized protein BDW43DRAFT_279009 [Aspergillus alliaceus]KAB8232586.1 hypothetical protein BDW43DRAFT_279009 [Aspergillus alliaceus]
MTKLLLNALYQLLTSVRRAQFRDELPALLDLIRDLAFKMTEICSKDDLDGVQIKIEAMQNLIARANHSLVTPRAREEAPQILGRPCRLSNGYTYLAGDTTTTSQKSIKFRSFLLTQRLPAGNSDIYPLPTFFSLTFALTLRKDILTQHFDFCAMISSAQPRISFEICCSRMI